MSWLNLGSLGGLIALAFLAWAAGGFRSPVPWRTVLTAGGLMLVLGAVVFWVPWTRTTLIWVNDTVITVLRAGNEGARFLFGPLALNPGENSPGGSPSVGFILAAQVLPAVVFFASLMAALYHLRILQPIVKLFAVLFHKTMGLSGAESLAGSSNIFIGALAPSRRGDLSSLGIPALVGATLATLMTGALAGFYYYGQKGLLGL